MDDHRRLLREVLWRPAAGLVLLLLAFCVCGATAGPARTVAAPLPFSFAADDYVLAPLPREVMPFYSASLASRVDPGCHDEHGVRMRIADGRLVDYPGGQASWGMDNLNSYVVTGDEFYLRRAEAQADRLIETSLHVGDAWFFPSRYARERHGQHGEPMTPPWFSCLGQGAGLALFCRFHEVTGDPRYSEAAHGVFRAFLQAGPVKAPWLTAVDDGYLWFEEWPKPTLDHTLNGHIFAVLGVYEYWRVFGDERARALFCGSATTVRRYLPEFRRPGWASRYCLLHGNSSRHYHELHQWQLLKLHTLTGDVRFARFADDLRADFPNPGDVPPTAQVGAGTYRVFSFRLNGDVVARRTLRLRAARTVAIDARQHVRGRAVYLRLAAGRLRGFWIRERVPRIYARGEAAWFTYYPSRTLHLEAGAEYVGEAFDPLGARTGTRLFTPAAATTATFSRRAMVNGVDRLLVDSGPLAGFWLASAGVHLE
jgi:hypothetical protein